LHYGRIILESGDEPVGFSTNGLETGLICLRGQATIRVEGDEGAAPSSPFDSVYIPRDAFVQITPGPSGCDLAEIAAPVSRPHPVQRVSYSDVQKDPGLHFEAGGPASKRQLNVLFGKNVAAGRIMAGVTFSQPGNWTSWPPHEHARLAEEAYLFIEMPPPTFGVQLVYTDKNEPELATIVREGDVVLMPEGYHPNVAAPGCTINFLWMMSAEREDVDRLFGVVNVHPDFASTASGLDAGRSGRR
jgi:5-deoxy-glucuronate isomerase